MPRFKIAHIHEQGQDIIIVPLEPSFGNHNEASQQETIHQLRLHAQGANLRGTVVPVWENGGRMMFIAPKQWHPYFQGLDMGRVSMMINRELFW